ncbi:uncharacterized protein BJ212DRAFT_1303722 [Suillus subaureus]|uniref:Uncharacterized protein n=1 Tax=Suillus subaureus TaxID=48587 RepID=A0A9P7DYD5_9AGAM|nr:uncharacterized protein BJ212DRAFT_1303722 [Suillus subaureus]KAG1806207.1 hypothetical protein BJ212DRAFT_1303722 [Suillus subaureus]
MTGSGRPLLMKFFHISDTWFSLWFLMLPDDAFLQKVKDTFEEDENIRVYLREFAHVKHSYIECARTDIKIILKWIQRSYAEAVGIKKKNNWIPVNLTDLMSQDLILNQQHAMELWYSILHVQRVKVQITGDTLPYALPSHMLEECGLKKQQ